MLAFGAVTTLQGDADEESTFDCTKRKKRQNLDTTDHLEAPSTRLLDLNDDCIYKIFEMTRVSLNDFYSLSQTCTRLAEIGCGIFQQKIKVFDLGKLKNWTFGIGVMKTFRSVISDLRMCAVYFSHEDASVIVESINIFSQLKSLIIEHCFFSVNQSEIANSGSLFKNLEKLHLSYVSIKTFDDTARETFISKFFADCESMISLKVIGCDYDLNGALFESSFPMLEHFEYKSAEYPEDNNIEDFILRHRNLKSLMLDCYSIENLDAAAECLNLTALKIRLTSEHLPTRPFRHYSNKSMGRFPYLKELTVNCAGRDAATVFCEVLPQLSESLECFHVESFSGSLLLMAALMQLKNLRVLSLRDLNCPVDITRIGEELTQLVELSLTDVEGLHIDLPKMVDNLVKLKKLKFSVDDFSITNQLYEQLVNVVKKRQPEDRHLEIYCRPHFGFYQEHQTVVIMTHPFKYVACDFVNSEIM